MLLSMFTEVILLSSAVFFFAICHSHWDEMDDYVRNVCGFRGKEVAKFRLPIWDLSIFTHSKVKMLTATITGVLYLFVAAHPLWVSHSPLILVGLDDATLHTEDLARLKVARITLLAKTNVKFANEFKIHLAILVVSLLGIFNGIAI